MEKINICDCGARVTVQYCNICTAFKQNENCLVCLYRCERCAERLG